MLCERCKKNEATTYYEQNINGMKSKYHLCSSCAQDMGVGGLFSDMFFTFPQEDHYIDSERCKKCGKTFEDIVRTGKVGCENCYIQFRDRMKGSLRNLHGKTSHIGKTPTEYRNTKTDEIAKLKHQLQGAIDRQEFELAAKIRDEIKDKEGEKNEK